MTERNTILDIAKGLTIILVVVGHFMPENSPAAYVSLNHWIYSFHMPTFFFLSGYVYESYRKDIPYVEFVWKKFRRLMIPYLFVSILIISIKLLTQGNMYVQNPVTFRTYVEILYVPSAGYYLWFIWSLFTIYLIVPLFKNKGSIYILFGISIILKCLMPYCSLPSAFALNGTQSNLPWFMLGVMSVLWRNNVPFISGIGVQTATIGLFAFFSILFISFDSFDNLTAVMPLFGIGSTLSVSSILEKYCKRSSHFIAEYLGAASFDIYLFHTTFEGLAKAVLQKFFNTPISGGLFYIEVIIVVLAGLTAPIILDRLVLRRYRLTGIVFGYAKPHISNK